MVPRSFAQNQDHSELTNKCKQYQQCKSENVLIWQFDKLVNLIRMSWQPGGQRREICSQFWGFDSALISLWSRLCQAVWRPSIGHKGREHRAKPQDSEYSQVVKRLEEPGTGILQSLLSSFVCPLHQDLALLHPNFQMTCCECFDQVNYFYFDWFYWFVPDCFAERCSCLSVMISHVQSHMSSAQEELDIWKPWQQQTRFHALEILWSCGAAARATDGNMEKTIVFESVPDNLIQFVAFVNSVVYFSQTFPKAKPCLMLPTLQKTSPGFVRSFRIDCLKSAIIDFITKVGYEED